MDSQNQALLLEPEALAKCTKFVGFKVITSSTLNMQITTKKGWQAAQDFSLINKLKHMATHFRFH